VFFSLFFFKMEAPSSALNAAIHSAMTASMPQFEWGFPEEEESTPDEPLSVLMDVYHTPGRGNRNCPKGVCREGSGYVASIRINKRQQKGPVRATVSEAARDRAQMMFMKATRTSVDVEEWIKSLKRKKRRTIENRPGIGVSSPSWQEVDPSIGRQQLAMALEQLMTPLEETGNRESTIQKILQQQAELQNQQVQILQELMLTQQNMMFSQSWDDLE